MTKKKIIKSEGIAHFYAAAKYSLQGLYFAYKHETAFRQEMCLFIIGTIISLFLPLFVVEKLLLISTMVLVLIVEVMNSAIEATVDRISLDQHPLSKAAKDLGSAAVFLSILLCVVTWCVMLWLSFR